MEIPVIREFSITTHAFVMPAKMEKTRSDIYSYSMNTPHLLTILQLRTNWRNPKIAAMFLALFPKYLCLGEVSALAYGLLHKGQTVLCSVMEHETIL